MNLKEYRTGLGITAVTASVVSGVPLRTYMRYEENENYGSPLKRQFILQTLSEKYEITEDKGVYTIDEMGLIIKNVFDKYQGKIKFCYVFGSYAKGYAKETSDIDLCVSTTMNGLELVNLIGELKDVLKKRIDLLRLEDLMKNIDLANEVMKDGIKIYG